VAAATFCVLAALSAAPVPLAASDGAGAGTVVSTGSLMSTGAIRDLQPVTVIEREEIELSGLRNLWDFIASRLSYNSFGLDRPFVLGWFRVAILVNGRSISDSTIDLDSLPVSAVERIEVLSDSAVALYGAQAIAGTVNIVLRDRFEGFEIQAGGENPVNGGGDTAHLSAYWGTAVGDGHLNVGVDLFRRNEIRESQRSYSRARWTPGGSFDDTNGVSLYGNTAFYLIPNPDGPRPTQSAAASLGDCEGGAFTGPLANPYGLPGHACGYAFADIAWSWEQRDRDALTVGLDHPVGEDHSLYFDARLVRSGFMFPRRAPALIRLPGVHLPAPLLPSTVGVPATVLHRFAGHGHRDASTDLEEHDLTMGAEGRLAYGIGYDAHLRSYRHDEDLEAGTYVHRRVLADPRYDLLNPLSTDPLHLEAIRDSSVRRYRNRFIEHRVARIAFDGRSPEVAGRTLGWAAGAEYAYEKRTRDPVYRDAAGNAVDHADVIGVFDLSFTGSRTRLSKFAELSVPLHERWEVVLAGRHDDHDEVESTTSHQVATRFRLREGLTLRGSFSRAAKAPGIGALNTARVVTRPRIFDPLTGYRYETIAVNSGNPELGEDRADSLGVGVVSEMGPVTLSADWYRMGLSRLLVIYPAQALVWAQARGATLPPGVEIVRDDAGFITRIVKPVSDDGMIDVSGLILRAQADWDTKWADFDLDVWWSHLTKFHERTPLLDGSPRHPRNRAHARLRAGRGDVTAQWSAYGLSDRPNPWGTSYPGWVGHDVSMRWENAFGIAGAEITGGVINVADREPSADPADPFWPDETLDSIRGRTLFLSLERSW